MDEIPTVVVKLLPPELQKIAKVGVARGWSVRSGCKGAGARVGCSAGKPWGRGRDAACTPLDAPLLRLHAVHPTPQPPPPPPYVRAQGYVVLNRPYAFVQWVQEHMPKIKERYILMCEPDHIFLKPIPLLATPTT